MSCVDVEGWLGLVGFKVKLSLKIIIGSFHEIAIGLM